MQGLLRASIVGFATLTLAACAVMTTTTGGPGTGPGDGDAGGSSGATGGGGEGGGGGTDSGGSSSGDGGSGRDGALPGQDGATGDSAAPDDRLMPLALGRTWTYDVASVGGGFCANGSHDVKVLGQKTVDGRNAFEVSSFCSGVGSAYETVNGDQADVDYQGTWNHFLDVPVQDGHSWPYFNTGYTWESVPTITVPAGTFTACWKAHQNVSYTAFGIYCRGVGMVQSYSQDLAGNGWDAKLTAKNF